MFKFIISIFVFFLILIKSSYSEKINKIEIIGNERISDETIKVFSGIDLSSDFETLDLNKILKQLYETNYFSDVQIQYENQILNIQVIENPIVQSIVIEGLKAQKFKDQVYDTLKIKEKNSFVQEISKKDVLRISNSLKKSGYYFSQVDLFVEKGKNNTVNLIYSIELNEKALIKQIQFIGDKVYKDRKLRRVIVSEEDKPWKFITSKKYLNEERISLDERLLKVFYINKGYYQVKISNAYAKYLDKNTFVVTFSINAGIKFKFNNTKLSLPDDYDKSKFKKIENLLSELKGETYSYNKIEKILKKIELVSLDNDFEFLDAKINEKIIKNNLIDFEIAIIESDKSYVERIDITGNSITEEGVIRNSLLIDEGDALNNILLGKSVNNLRARGIFKNVTSKINEGTSSNKKIINLNVEEKATGEISAGAGVGTSGGTIAFGIKENNYLGKGINLKTNVVLSEDSIKGRFDYVNPNFRSSDKSLILGFGATTIDKLADYGYKTEDKSFNLGTRYEQYEDVYFKPVFKISHENLLTNDSASAALKKQEGEYFDANLFYEFDYDKRNQRFQPTSGFRSKFIQQLPVISDNASILNGYEFINYHELVEDNISSFSLYTRAVNSVSNDDVRISNRLFLPSRKLRGFESGRIGPVDDGDHVGGNYAAALNFNTDLPYFFNTMQNVDVKWFLDAANVWGVDYSGTIAQSSKIRSAAGLAVDWFTPVGPLTFSLAEVLSKDSTDKTESFRFNIGTTF